MTLDKPNEERLPDSKQPSGVSTSQPAPAVISIPSLGQGASGAREPSTKNDGPSRG
jgi:hypothetical protein